MAFWWVSQNKTYEHERAGGYLWAPLLASDGSTFYHWKNLELVRPGDLIFSYVGKQIVAVSVSMSAAYLAPRPPGLDENTWDVDGNRIDVKYCELSKPLWVASVLTSLEPLLPEKYSPIDKNGDGVYGYLFEVPPAAGYLIASRILRENAIANRIET